MQLCGRRDWVPVASCCDQRPGRFTRGREGSGCWCPVMPPFICRLMIKCQWENSLTASSPQPERQALSGASEWAAGSPARTSAPQGWACPAPPACRVSLFLGSLRGWAQVSTGSPECRSWRWAPVSPAVNGGSKSVPLRGPGSRWCCGWGAHSGGGQEDVGPLLQQARCVWGRKSRLGSLQCWGRKQRTQRTLEGLSPVGTVGRVSSQPGAFLFLCGRNLGTVGAVALDCRGDVAYATSTGGTVNKMCGRVGDSPCVGSGGYADNSIGAVSTTGHGESILKVNLARLALFHLEQGKTVEEAAELALGYMKSKLKALGGLILVSRTGHWVAKWTSASMPWAAVKGGKVHAGIDLGDSTVMDLS
ncbi:isoaspartyl peptidase/L-asparaginase isoform X1 [Heterocephalus glaber]|uniref:Isoaspartyl peptidase/L-asparaginase n=1 Tax=Heterocephalus glaber TaxID=10181 RepID=A0AAX6SE91_HETGA|nr:isoaspartyl peptidase/L-asparaginase isoform X1 [Heterocephalus glaber]